MAHGHINCCSCLSSSVYIENASMFAVLLFGLVACASAAPHYYSHYHHPPPFDHQHLHHGPDFDDFFQGDIFDTTRFWDGLRREMLDLERAMNEMTKRFSAVTATVLVKGNEYKITIPLEGFKVEEIVVKAKSKLLMVQAVHNSEDAGQKSSLHMYTLPDYVDPAGQWTYTDSILTITFPIRRDGTEPEQITTIAPEHSREEMDKDNDDGSEDADVGVKRGDQADTELNTNEISRGRQSVEATTYAVDLKEDVEFVPMNMNNKH